MKFKLYRDPLNSQKLISLNILYGDSCACSYACKFSRSCKYARIGRLNTKRHNLRVSINRWFQYNLHIKLPWLIYVSVSSHDLSGTRKCPYHLSRRFTCNACSNSYYDNNLEGCCCVPIEERTPVPTDSEYFRDWGDHYRCGCIDVLSCYKNYNKYTGELS